MFVARVIPAPRKEKFSSFKEFVNEFVRDELEGLNITGIPVYFDHDDKRQFNNAGRVTKQFFDNEGNMCAEVCLTSTNEAYELMDKIKRGEYKEVSLGHRTTRHTGDMYSKTPVELSACKKGKRDSPILKFYDHDSLNNMIKTGFLQCDPRESLAMSQNPAPEKRLKFDANALFFDPSHAAENINVYASFDCPSIPDQLFISDIIKNRTPDYFKTICLPQNVNFTNYFPRINLPK